MREGIILQGNAGLFFWSLLQGQSLDLTDEALVYVVGVLVSFSRSDTAYAGVAPGERPVLVDFLVRAQEAEGPEQGEIYKHVGDLALFTAGLFSTSLVVDRGYYVSVGQGAYGSAAAWQRPTTAAVLQELSDRLPDVTDALTDAIVKVPSPLA